MRVIQVYWFTNFLGNIGVVVAEDNTSKQRKAYIGLAKGLDEKADTESIMTQGTRVDPRTLLEMLTFIFPVTKEKQRYKLSGPGRHATRF